MANTTVTCPYILPGSDRPPAYDGEMHQCLLPEGHQGQHLVHLDISGYVLWERDWDCECETESCDCILYKEISAAEAQKMLQTNPHPK